jgi:hypothetical protein
MYEITHSLLSSWKYLYNAYDGEKAQKDFMRNLNRIKSEPTVAMQKGIDFENAVERVCNGDINFEFSPLIAETADIVKDGLWQVKYTKHKIIENTEYLLVGRFDVLKCGTIYDLKYSERYECGKYIESTQHPMYFELEPNAKDFKYVVCDGKAVYIERYIKEETPKIDNTIIEFMEFLEIANLKSLYFEKWKI